ncbi:hypothetical protein [Desulfoluna spongiiphila]|uniref:hypothetical protein n=1 Tax=Desulfoluna spongiiphila TaxID=419481 RepID=UPI00125F3859|nr:hypothetical protein [Desulfoluna spongiiphila]
MDWYNNRHLHSGACFITPADRHSGKEKDILMNRHRVYQEARRMRPERWGGDTRNWEPVEKVVLNRTKRKKEHGDAAVDVAA